MPNLFVCVRCGYPEKDHNPNLVNDPISAETAWIEQVKPAYRLTILECMETSLPEEYLEKKSELYWENQRWGSVGYQSPNPEEEARRSSRDAIPGGSHTFLLIPGRKPISTE